eukprot:CAMPEP_0178423542 /NCGR_PEP_ID=MMETSP0689_2-20121128/27742_1 /TAXON_ID=160604 /ORGANISM="Amphidinium massartii, Strain CS-259" /LENGTH=163 /DNA_ID=CAMNT_0020045139 /DNA_START=776 /DNA_END=1267 /DNA_ORIENTATION=-
MPHVGKTGAARCGAEIGEVVSSAKVLSEIRQGCPSFGGKPGRAWLGMYPEYGSGIPTFEHVLNLDLVKESISSMLFKEAFGSMSMLAWSNWPSLPAPALFLAPEERRPLPPVCVEVRGNDAGDWTATGSLMAAGPPPLGGVQTPGIPKPESVRNRPRVTGGPA